MNIVELLEESARENSYKKINKVWLEIGPFSGVEIEALKFGFDVSTYGTILDGAVLNVIATRGKAWCSDCRREVELVERYAPCPECNGRQLQITGGEELKIKQISVKE